MKTVTKKDLVDRITRLTGQKRLIVKKIIQCFLDEILAELGQGNRIEFRDFGVFELRERAPRIGQNPKTLEKVRVPGKRTVKFKCGRLMRDRLAHLQEQPREQGNAEPAAPFSSSVGSPV
jgi:integration host factor subunit beta